MKSFFYLLLTAFLTFSNFAQQIDENYFKENTEVYFKFLISDRAELNTLTNIISIDNVNGNLVFAYANENEFKEFEKLNYSYTILPHPGKVNSTRNVIKHRRYNCIGMFIQLMMLMWQ